MSNMPTLRDVVNGTAADATDLEWNFNTIETHIDEELVNRDGTVAMTAALTLVDGAPTLAAHATRKDYVDDLVTTFTQFTRSTTMTILNADPYSSTDVVWETEVADPDGWGATGSATLTCPAAGMYLVNVAATILTVPSPPAYIFVDIVPAGDATMFGEEGEGFSRGDYFGTTGVKTRTAPIRMAAGATLKVVAGSVFPGGSIGATEATINAINIYINRLR